MDIRVRPDQIASEKGGLCITVEGFTAEGFKGSPCDDAPEPYVHLEYIEGKLQIHIRDGSGENPIITHTIPRAKPSED